MTLSSLSIHLSPRNMSTKKRKVSVEDSPEDVTHLASSAQKRQRNAPFTKYSAKSKQQNEVFIDHKTKLYHAGVQQIMAASGNELTTGKLPSPTSEHPNFCRDAVLELRTKVGQVRDLYARPTG